MVAELVEQGHIKDVAAPPVKTGEESPWLTAKSGGEWKAFLLVLILVLLVGVGVAFYFKLPPFSP